MSEFSWHCHSVIHTDKSFDFQHYGLFEDHGAGAGSLTTRSALGSAPH